MAHVEIPLNTLIYHFRKLNWRKELWLSEQSAGGEVLIRLYLTHALVEWSRWMGEAFPWTPGAAFVTESSKRIACFDHFGIRSHPLSATASGQIPT
jgi:hypothetical protein